MTTTRHLAALAAVALLAGGAPHALAAQQPYMAVQVTYDVTGADDPALKAFVATLQKAVNEGDVATLKQSVAPDLAVYTPTMGFPEEQPAGPLANPDKHPGEQRLDEAAILTTSSDSDYSREDLDGLIVDLFGTALEPQRLGRSHTAGGALCSPAEPTFDRTKVLAVADAAGVPPGNLWILSEKTDFHETASAKSPVIETLPANSIVPFLEGSVDPAMPDEGEADWYSVALPSGKTGFAAEDASLAFQSISVCYGKVADKWAVTAVIVPGI